MNEADHKQIKNQTERREHKAIEGRRIAHQLPCQPHPIKHKLKHQYQSKETSDIETFRTLLTKRDRNKESQSKLQHRPLKKNGEELKQERNYNKKEVSISRSKSKGMSTSKSLKQLVKKSKSLVRLEPKKDHHREERKSQSPHHHAKSTLTYADRKQCKSNYHSKTARQLGFELPTDREKSKSKLKLTKPFKKHKMDTTKKSAVKSNKTKSEKENIKVEKKNKHPKGKKEKRVFISEQNSKVRQNCEQWQLSFNEDEFLDPKQCERKQNFNHNNESNIVNIPKRKERLSLNSSHPRKPSLKNKTQVYMESYQSRKLQLQTFAAIQIQRVFRGYITRKYIKECFQYNAVLKIQRIWRGYRARKQVKKIRKQKIKEVIGLSPKQPRQTQQILEQEQYLLQKQLSRSDIKSYTLNQRWTSILEEILFEESVNQNIKKKIQNFLQTQKKQHQFEPLQSNRSPSVHSGRSSLSSQVIINEMTSQKHFIEKERLKKDKQNNQNLFMSPNQHLSPGRLYSSSPQGQFGSPHSRLASHSPPISSTELLIANLKSIQRGHRDRLQSKANDDKEQLNNMLIKNKLSPRAHQKKYKEVDLFLVAQLQKFNESINQIVKNCILYEDEVLETPPKIIVTPKKQLTQLNLPSDISPRQHPVKAQEMSLQLKEYYEVQGQNGQKIQIYEPFDTTYQFIEEYLISLIDFVRQYDSGGYVSKLLSWVHKSRSRQIETIMQNLKIVTQGSEQQQNLFGLPMYKYIDLQQQIIQSNLIEQFNKIFPKLQYSSFNSHSSLQYFFIKMIADSMNEALNSLRPQSFPFVQAKLASLNALKGLEKIPFECQSSEEEMQYQFTCAQALNKIFYWNRLEWGKIIRYQQDGQAFSETRHFLMKQLDNSILQIQSQQNWVFYEELIEIIGNLTEELFQTIIFQEIAAVWGIFMEWLQKIGRTHMHIQPPNSSIFYLP